MRLRISIKDLEPDAYKAMFSLEKYLSTSQINSNLKELIKIRASQINGCAYCIQIHTTDARKIGETEQRIYALSAWKESPLFNETEKTAFAVTEEITHISKEGLTDRTFEKALHYFGEKQTAQLIMLISTINVWNRIAVSTHLFHES
jgi:AhpD family alkylhydroperoxidase